MRAILKASVTAFALISSLTTAGSSLADEPIDLKIIYAGNPGSDRERDYTTFLRKYFVQVDTVDLRSFSDEKAQGHDVVIIDWTSIYPRDEEGKIEEPLTKLNWPKGAIISEAYARPTILVGAVGVEVIRPLGWKIDNLCICLGDSAHGLASEHDIFRTPLKVDLIFYDAPTPPHYPALSAGEPVGKTIRAWKVQTKEYPEIDPGMVSSPFGFEDLPDAEVISSGLNEKTPGSVAIGRQGNFFLWGFSASPSDMTPEARKCFVNSVCYIKKFDGQRPIARKSDPSFSREYSLIYAHSLKSFRDEKSLARMFPLLAKKPELIKGVLESERKLFEGTFSKELRDELGDDPEKYAAWVKENYEWLRPVKDDPYYIQIAVDEDAKALGLSNRNPEILDACVALLERGERIELALRILRRYTSENFTDARQWRTWLDSVRDRLYFDEVGLFKFTVAPKGLNPPPRYPRTPLSARTSPTRQHPVVATVECIPNRVRPGEEFAFVVRVETAPTWHITAVSGSKGPEIATSISLKTPRDITPFGDWIYPEPIPGFGERLTYEGTFEFSRRLRAASEAPAGLLDVTCTLGYQACDRFSCQMPSKLALKSKIEIY